MQALVYTFIALAAAAAGLAAWFGLAFSPANAILLALVLACVFVLVLERSLRRRAEARLEKAIGELSRLLATDAQAGATLSQRVNQLAGENAGRRLEVMEADLSVLGTVVRQVAEAVADLEQARPEAAPALDAPPAASEKEREPTIALAELRRALAEHRLVHHVQPVVTLPQRRPYGYGLVPRLIRADGGFAEPEEFMPRRNGEAERREIDGAALVEAVTLGRRARAGGQPLNLFLPVSRATLTDSESAEQLLVTLEANRTLARSLLLVVEAEDWHELAAAGATVLERIAAFGAGFSLAGLRSLRLDIAALSARGVHSLRVDAAAFLADTGAFTDFHASDIASYLARYGVDLLVTGIVSEAQILELLDNGVSLVEGPHIAPPAPARPELFSERPAVSPPLRRAGG